MNREEIETGRGDEDIVFIQPELDMEKASEKEEPRKFIMEKMKAEGLKWVDARIIGLFSEEFSLMLEDGGEVLLEGEEIYSQ